MFSKLKGEIMKLDNLIRMWDGFFFVLLSAAVLLVVMFLFALRNNLLKGFLKTVITLILGVLVVAYILLFIHSAMVLLIENPTPIPFLLCLAILVLGGIYFGRSYKKSRTAEAINAARLNKNPIVREMTALIRKERPEMAVIYINGAALGDISSLKVDELRMGAGSSMLPLGIKAGNGISHVIDFNERGYKDMDYLTRKSLADMLVKATDNGYQIKEIEHTHTETVYSSGLSEGASGFVSSTGEITISGGHDGYTTMDVVDIIFELTRNDLVKKGPEPQKPQKLKNW